MEKGKPSGMSRIAVAKAHQLIAKFPYGLASMSTLDDCSKPKMINPAAIIALMGADTLVSNDVGDID